MAQQLVTADSHRFGTSEQFGTRAHVQQRVEKLVDFGSRRGDPSVESISGAVHSDA